MLAAAGASAQPVQLSAMAQLGKDMFFDRSLSGSGAMSCATATTRRITSRRPTIRPCRSAGPISASRHSRHALAHLSLLHADLLGGAGGRGERGGRCDADGGGQRGREWRSGRPIGGCAAGDGQERNGQRRQHGAARRHVLGRAGRYASGSGAGAADVALRDGQSGYRHAGREGAQGLWRSHRAAGGPQRAGRPAGAGRRGRLCHCPLSDRGPGLPPVQQPL